MWIESSLAMALGFLSVSSRRPGVVVLIFFAPEEHKNAFITVMFAF